MYRSKDLDLTVFQGGTRGVCIQVAQQANVCGQARQIDNRWVDEGRAFNFVELSKKQAWLLAIDLMKFSNGAEKNKL
jgi:hypothetical protein